MRQLRLALRCTCLILLIVYIWYTLDTTIFGRSEYADYRYEILPFWSYIAIVNGKDSLIKEDLLNVALFAPIGFLLLYVLPQRRWWKALLFGLGFSCFIELLQLIGKRGTCEFDDLFHNTIGCLIGYFIAWLLVVIFKVDEKENFVQMKSMSIFEIQQSKQDKDFVLHNGNLEFEVFADILKTAGDLPYIGSLFKLGKVAVNYMDYRFVRKLHFFLAESENIEPERKERFLNSLNENDYKRINAMMTHLLYSAEEDGKAMLMGKIYRSRLLGEIDEDMMLRLCSVVNRAFLADLDHLEEYEEDNNNNYSYIKDNLNSLGLLRDLGGTYQKDDGEWVGMGFGPTIHRLNHVGNELLRIKNS